MKSLFFFCIGMVLTFQLRAQNQNHIELIERFIKSIESEKVTVQDLYKQGIVQLSENSLEKIETLNDEYTKTILLSIRSQLNACKADENESYEVLSLEQSIDKKEYDSDIQVPENGSIYLLYCNKDIITHFLVRDDKIGALSTINKGGKRIFMIL